jgi:pimeloyl-ACP methyl ester carboxylesterase
MLVLHAPVKVCSCAAQVRDISQEVLLIWGKQDEILDRKYVKEFERDLKHIDVRMVDECGHLAHLEQSQACAAAILEFAGVAQAAVKA